MPDRVLNVLLVEDDPDDVFLLRDMLAGSPGAALELIHAPRLSAALELIQAGGLDAALLDLSLPDSQGMETFERVHAAAPDLPVVVLTGLNDEWTAVEVVQKGAQDYLVKGQVQGPLLVRSLRYALERQRNSTFQALLSERERFDAAIAQLGDGIVATDGALRITSANRAGELLLNLVESDWHGMPLADALSGFALSVRPRELLESADPVTELEVSRTETRPPLYLEGALSRLFDSMGNLVNTVLVLRDVTAERLARNVQANFFTLVPQKLRGPLAVLGGYLEVSRHLSPQRMAQEWPQILQACEGALAQVSDIVQRLLDFNALTAWQVEDETRHTPVAGVMEQVVDQVRMRHPERGLEVEMRVAEGAATVDVTAEHLGFVLNQLLDNAAKFAIGDPVQVVVTVGRDPGDSIVFSVRDEGPGIPHEDLDRIFEGFAQVDERVTGQVPGLGVGLSLARHVLNSCGGDISVRSALGESSEFIFTLPAPLDHQLGAGDHVILEAPVELYEVGAEAADAHHE